MNLYLLRHGIAVEPGTAGCELDSERPLTAKGKKRLRVTSQAMKKLELSFDLILSSPFLRAKQTAEIVAKALKLRKKLEFTVDSTVEPDAAGPEERAAGRPRAVSGETHRAVGRWQYQPGG
jgi:phosphohistidine phosphatase SixA